MDKLWSKCFFLLFVNGANSCAPVYVPSNPIMSLTNKGKQLYVHGSYGKSSSLQAGVSIHKNISLTANGFIEDKTIDESNSVKHNYRELALGYSFTKNELLYRFYLGYGNGNGKSKVFIPGFPFLAENRTKSAEGLYQKYFIQPSIGYEFKDIRTQFIFSSRLSKVDFYKFKLLDNTINPIETNTTTSGLFIDPNFGMIIRPIENSGVAILLNFGASASLNPKRINFDHRDYVVSVGAGYCIGRR